MFTTCWAAGRHKRLGFFSDDHYNSYAKVIALRLSWCYCPDGWGCYSLMHFEIWLFRFDSLNLKSFYLNFLWTCDLTAVGSMYCSLYHKNHSVSWKRVLGFHSSCVKCNRDLNHRVNSSVLLWGKFSLAAHIWQRDQALGECAERLPSQLCYPSLKQPQENHLNSFPQAFLLWNKSIIIYYLCLRLGTSEVPSFYQRSQHYQVHSGGDMLYYAIVIELHQEIIPWSRVQMDGKIQR